MPRTTRIITGLVALALVSAVPAAAQTIRLTTTLSGANETPAPGLLSGATGFAEVFVNLNAQTLTYEIDIFNMPAVTSAGHFHVGGPGLAGPVVVDLAPPPVTDDFSLRGSASASNFTPRVAQGIRTWQDFLQALVGGQVYVNIHSLTNPGGEIRGQLLPAPQ